MKVVIVGAGGHAAELQDYILYGNQYNTAKEPIEIVGFIDDNPDSYNAYSFSAPFLGAIKTHNVLDAFYVIGVANIAFRRTIISNLLSRGAQFISLIHPTAIVSPSAKIGLGCVISHNSSIGPNAVLGDFNLINSRCTIGHDTNIGNYNFLSPQVVTGGFSKMGDENFLGTNAAVLPRVILGSNNVVSAGMIVEKSVEDNQTIFHRFKERITIVKTQE
ncbi:acetyltransferase [Flavobacterium aurantiibacter]|uniref:Sugar O-acyltransferase n=1 Tax=Flavobacterium aurantiibacter TaxID=2023067 RepID=A0A255ZRD6_9FLAO|nr:acetyltransferase [Flavobacterium aurantiibacter]OYQ43942.1 sugar O-acyltransferase [Flavobacterium aurantiibacter]